LKKELLRLAEIKAKEEVLNNLKSVCALVTEDKESVKISENIVVANSEVVPEVAAFVEVEETELSPEDAIMNTLRSIKNPITKYNKKEEVVAKVVETPKDVELMEVTPQNLEAAAAADSNIDQEKPEIMKFWNTNENSFNPEVIDALIGTARNVPALSKPPLKKESHEDIRKDLLEMIKHKNRSTVSKPTPGLPEPKVFDKEDLVIVSETVSKKQPKTQKTSEKEYRDYMKQQKVQIEARYLGEKPNFICNLCHKKFNSESVLKKHMEGNHSVERREELLEEASPMDSFLSITLKEEGVEEFDALQDSLGESASLARKFREPSKRVDYTQSSYFMTHHHLMEVATHPNGFTETLPCLPPGWRVRTLNNWWQYYLTPEKVILKSGEAVLEHLRLSLHLSHSHLSSLAASLGLDRTRFNSYIDEIYEECVVME